MLWAALLLVVSVVLPAAAAVVLVGQLVRAAMRRRLLPAELAPAFAEVATAAAMIGLVVYGIGSWQGHLIDPRSASEVCGGQVARALQQSPLPLHNRCELVGGRTFDLVPGWINPVLAVSLAIVVSCSVLAVQARTRRRSSSPVTPDGRPA